MDNGRVPKHITALHFKDNSLYTAVTFYKKAKSYIVKKNKDRIVEEVIESIDIS